MGFDNKYPYTDFHELNLDWFLQEFNKLLNEWADLAADNAEFKQTMTERFGTLSDTVHEFTTFVTNYFDNLDVQQEINNKLNDMVEDGTLSELLRPYFNAFTVEINARMRNQDDRILVLEGRMNTFTHLTDGSTSGDAELADIRVEIDGTIAANAGDAVRQQVRNTISIIDLLDNGYTIFKSPNWKIGNQVSTVGEQARVNTAFNNRMGIDETFTAAEDIVVSVPSSGWRVTVVYVDDDDIVTGSMKIEGIAPVNKIFAGEKFRIGVEKVPASVVTDIYEYIYSVKVQSISGKKIRTGYQDALSLKEGLVDEFYFEAGGITNTGAKSSAYKGVRVIEIVSFPKDTVIRCTNKDYAISLFKYNRGGSISADKFDTYLGSFNAEYVLKANNYYGIVIRKIDNTDITIEEGVSSFEVWSDFKTKMNKFNSILKFAPIGNTKRKIISHKGCTLHAPENTTMSFTDSALGGAWGIETDIQGTSDGYLICMHDSTVDRTTNGSGTVNQMTLAEIEALHIKDYDNLKVPTLEDYLEICKTYDCVPFMELKNIAGDVTLIKKLIDTVEAYGLKEKSVIICSSYSIGRVHVIDPTIRTVFNVKPNNFDAEFAAASDYDNNNISLDLTYGTVTQDMIKRIHEKGMAAFCFLVNNVDDIKEYIASGIDAVLSDFITTY